MKTLIAEDDFTSRLLLQELLKGYGPCDTAVNGQVAVLATAAALAADDPYDLICLDVMMPEMDGRTALKTIRQQEEDENVRSADVSKIVMTTAVDDIGDVMDSFYNLCDAYLVKPVDTAKLLTTLRTLGLIA